VTDPTATISARLLDSGKTGPMVHLSRPKNTMGLWTYPVSVVGQSGKIRATGEAYKRQNWLSPYLRVKGLPSRAAPALSRTIAALITTWEERLAAEAAEARKGLGA
jgi:hypothetical protein